MSDLTRVVEIITEWELDLDTNWDDLHEWDAEECSSRYFLSKEAGTLLWYYIQIEQDSRYSAYGLEESLAPIVLENIQESLHQSLDGWTEEEKLVIQAYLADLAYATRLTSEDRVKAQIYTYVVFKSDYMGEEPKMYEWSGTWRGLLEHLHGTLDKNVHEWAQGKTDEYLKTMFDDMNGDGMSYYMVYNVEAREQVIDQ